MKQIAKLALLPAVAVLAVFTLETDSRAITPIVGVTLELPPATVNASPGETGVVVNGTVTNTDTVSYSYSFDGFTLISGPGGYDPSTAITLDGLVNPPDFLDQTGLPGDTYTGPLFDLNIDPSAPNGLYQGQFSVDYVPNTSPGVLSPLSFNSNNRLSGSQTFNINLGPSTSAVPEPGTITIFCAGLAVLGLIAFRTRKASSKKS